MTKQQIIDYVMHTPYNTNKAVLESMLDSISSDGGGSEGFLTVPGIATINTEYISAKVSLPSDITPTFPLVVDFGNELYCIMLNYNSSQAILINNGDATLTTMEDIDTVAGTFKIYASLYEPTSIMLERPVYHTGVVTVNLSGEVELDELFNFNPETVEVIVEGDQNLNKYISFNESTHSFVLDSNTPGNIRGIELFYIIFYSKNSEARQTIKLFLEYNTSEAQ